MFCTYCGKKISGESKFCRFCGRETGVVSVQNLQTIPDREEEKKVPTFDQLNRRRKTWIGWVLVAVSVLGMIGVFFTAAEGGSGTTDSLESFGNNPLPYVIDLIFGIQLIRQKEDKYLNWVLVRVVLGFILWGIIAASSQEWGSVIVEAIYSAYFIYLIKFPLTERSLKIANFIILPLAIIGAFFL